MSFQISGAKVFTHKAQDLVVVEHLPLGTYVVKYDERSCQFYLEQAEHMQVPPKIYGNTTKNADRIVNTFFDRPEQTGVHLEGEKGSGKTLLTKVLSKKLREENQISTILVNTAFAGESFNTFINSITDPCMIVFDEFEKVYDRERQEATLTLFDGTRNTKKLFVITTNTWSRICDQIYNRPGRFYYRLRYEGLEEAFIKEYAEDMFGVGDPRVTDIVNTSKMFGQDMNFDMLKALIEEMLRYDEPASEAIKMLNIKITGQSTNDVIILSFLDPERKAVEPIWKILKRVSLSNGFYVRYKEVDEDGDESEDSEHFDDTHIKNIEEGIYTLVNDYDYELKFMYGAPTARNPLLF